MTATRKLIEVALPLEAINSQSAREKSIRHGHPSTLHLWWARRPLATCRAVLFASLVDDPSSYITDEEQASVERRRLFSILRDLVKWENSDDKTILNDARLEIARSAARTKGEKLPNHLTPKEIRDYLRDNVPPVLDPFCGGGSIPLEAQRLGLRVSASDLNPVAVLITRALTVIPSKFAGKSPVNPSAQTKIGRDNWEGPQGLAEDIRYYGKWMKDEAEKKIGHLYPKVTLPDGKDATVVAWLWARTIECPNPTCRARMPLVKSFLVAKKHGKSTWVNYSIDRRKKIVCFTVGSGTGSPPVAPKVARGAKFKCLACEQPVDEAHIKREGTTGNMGSQLMAVVADTKSGRVYCPPIEKQARTAEEALPKWAPEEELAYDPRAIWCTLYGLKRFRDLFSPRQTLALTTFSGLVSSARKKCFDDAVSAGMPNDGRGLDKDGSGAQAYADAVAIYLGFAVDRLANRASTICIWNSQREEVEQTFGRQALPMNWDYAEANVFSDSTGSWSSSLEWIPKVIERLPVGAPSSVEQLDATVGVGSSKHSMVCTDPPYYDNIGYADLSDFFYVWLRHSLASVYPDLFSTLLSPKKQELIATPYRHDGSWDVAAKFFEEGLAKAFLNLRERQDPSYPMSVFYAYKQTEDEEVADSGDVVSSSTGWETMLEGLLKAGLSITATWPVRTERDQGLKSGTNVLASSIVLVCHPQRPRAPIATQREFVETLRKELPAALLRLQEGSIAPVDLAQAAIGPGMAVFSRFTKVLRADGTSMSVRSALQVINQELEAFLKHEEGEMDPETQFCLSWFEQYGNAPGPFGEADVLARAKDTSVETIERLGVVNSRGGKVWLKPRSEFPAGWNPAEETHLTLWGCTQYLVKRYLEDGEGGAADIAATLGGGRSEDAKTLAYRLFDLCERKGWSEEGRSYNEFVTSWSEIQKRAAGITGAGSQKVFSVE